MAPRRPDTLFGATTKGDAHHGSSATKSAGRIKLNEPLSTIFRVLPVGQSKARRGQVAAAAKNVLVALFFLKYFLHYSHPPGNRVFLVNATVC